MRTTLNLDDDIAAAVKERAHWERRTAGAVLSDLARQALTHSTSDDATDEQAFHGFRPFPRRGVIVTNDLINQIRDEEGI